MKTREIPRDEWAAFFDDLSRQHEGGPVTIEILETDLDPEPEVRRLTLRHVAAQGESITLVAEQSSDERLTHTIVAPTSVRLAETEDEAHRAVKIESANRMMTILIFRDARAPRALTPEACGRF